MGRRILASILAGACILGLSIWYVRTPGPEPEKKKPESPPVVSVSHLPALDYNRDILPILSSKCFACHGPDSGSRKAGLRLDLRDGALKPGKSGAVPIVPGKSADSEALRRIVADDDTMRMPPKKTGKTLTDKEKDLIKRWIDAGANYQPHWAFVKVARPGVPSVKNNDWGRNEIDAFILHRLEAAGLQPSRVAEPTTLVRRLSLDLRGLPPTLQEVDEFVAAWDAPKAKREEVWTAWVERMLASPHFGEKMALGWLDLARFGDTSGYHMDSTRQMSLWRDWVINAFNQNMPFDQFTIEQLAGDLLPNASLDQKIASGFNRNTRFNEEGGVDPEEYVIRYNIDRTNTLGQVWLGLTLSCAECHSHKYDPISHKEYYQLFAYFTGLKEPMLSGPEAHGKPLPPLVSLPTAEQAKDLAEQRKWLAILEPAIARQLAKLPADFERQAQIAWEARAKDEPRVPADIRAVLKIESARRGDAQKKVVREYYLRKISDEAREYVGALDRDVEERTRKIKQIEDAVPYCMVSEEMPTPRPAHVLIRGDFLHKGERVERGVPAAFPPLPADAPNNRLGLARWLVRPDHPLTARVTVNRLWAQMFGAGIVRTIGDFGTQGEFPSHPELLDWLASEFVRTGWNVKATLRTIAMSATYRQSAAIPDAAAKTDPHNRLLSHMPRFRLTAEELRDNALTIAGLLNRKVGGPSFMPYQPPDFYKNKNEEWPWSASEGAEQYRRGLYAFWRRTALHPMFAILDAPNREECTASRPRTNTPLTALVTLNDPTFAEAARVFAQRILTQGPKDGDGRLAFAFRCATCRAPSPKELQVLRQEHRQQIDRYRADASLASKLVNVGQSPRDASLDVAELAAWTATANMLLNLDEVLTRE